MEASSQRQHCSSGLIVFSSAATDETDGSPACSFHSSSLFLDLLRPTASSAAPMDGWMGGNGKGKCWRVTGFQNRSRLIYLKRFSFNISLTELGFRIYAILWNGRVMIYEKM